MRRRVLTLIAIALIVPLGFALKLVRFGPTHQGPVTAYANNSLAGVAYEVFWCLVLFFLFPRRRAIGPICVGVFLATTALEFLQLYHPPPPHPLTTIRSTFLGRALLGNTFTWLDVPHYALGCVIGWGLLTAISRGPVRRSSGDPHQEKTPNPSGSGASDSDA